MRDANNSLVFITSSGSHFVLFVSVILCMFCVLCLAVCGVRIGND